MIKHNHDAIQALEERLRKIHATNRKNGWYNDRVTIMLTTLFPSPRPNSLWEWVRQLVETRLISSTRIERPFAFSLNQPHSWLTMLETGQLAWRKPSHTAYEVVNLRALSSEDLQKVATEIEQWWIVYRRPVQSTQHYRPEAR